MDRRGFLSTAAAGAGLAGAATVLPAWLTGCGGAGVRPELSARDTTDLLARLDRGLASIDAQPFSALAAHVPWRTRFETAEPLLRLGTQALVVADVARSIPANARVSEALRARMLESLPILDRATSAYHGLLVGTPPAVRRNVDAELRRSPDAVMDVAAFLDGRAGEIGISDASRARMRSNAHWVGTRMRRQSASATIDECVAKVERAVTRAGGSAAALRAGTTGALIDALWTAVDGEGASGLATPAPIAAGTAGLYVPVGSDPELAAGAATETGSPGDDELVAGGICLGVGPVVFGLGTLLGYALGASEGAMWGAIISATPGSALVIVGIVLLIVGAVQNGRAS